MSLVITICIFTMWLSMLATLLDYAVAIPYYEKTVQKGSFWKGYILIGTTRGYYVVGDGPGTEYFIMSEHYGKAKAGAWMLAACWVHVWGDGYWRGQLVDADDDRKYSSWPYREVETSFWLAFDCADKVRTRVKGCFDDGWNYYYYTIEWDELTIIL